MLADAEELITRCEHALAGGRRLQAAAMDCLASSSRPGGAPGQGSDQHGMHGLAWWGTTVAGLEAMLTWARRLELANAFGELEQGLLGMAFGEGVSQLQCGLSMSQTETVRPRDLGISLRQATRLLGDDAGWLAEEGNTAYVRARVVEMAVAQGGWGNPALPDSSLELISTQFMRFADERVAPRAKSWHRNDTLIPLSLIQELAALGVFGLTIAEANGGLGMGKLAMCVVTEQLSRGCLAVGSLATRAEIAAELISNSGTSWQRSHWLPRIADGRTLPAAAFTEPDAGSDLASVRTRAIFRDGAYRLSGGKTWITHAARADLMTVLARTEAASSGPSGLSILLVPKQPASNGQDFPTKGLSGSEISVLGYRGMKEYELAFDNFEVSGDALLGSEPGHGFRQLMSTFESARIQTAARAVGVAQNALDLAATYALQRRQFGRPLARFARIQGKLANMAAQTMMARQLTWAAALRKDAGERCDVPAGMAKLYAAQVAWANADSALQVHGGNGYAEEYEISRVLCDARVLSIFEGASEIQAGVIAKGLFR